MKNIIITTVGTNIHSVLTHLLQNPNLKFESKKEARIYFEEEQGVEMSRSSFNKCIDKYNKGRYSVDGVDATRQKINLDARSKSEKLKIDDAELFGEDLSISEIQEIKSSVSDAQFEKPDQSDWNNLCDEAGIDPRLTKLWWDKRDSGMSICYINPTPPSVRNYNLDEALGDIVEGINTDGIKRWEPIQTESEKALNVVISDAHVGMCPKGGMFAYEYNAEVYKEKMKGVFSNIVKEYETHGHFEEIVISNLGDQEDGWMEQTTRGGHNLPQNMRPSEIFNACTTAHVELVESIVAMGITNKVILRSCTNDNHSGVFADVVATGTKMIINKMFSDDVVEVDILDDFVSLRTFGNHAFLLTHGKDKDHMKRGWTLQLNDGMKNKVNEIIDYLEIKEPYIHVLKGDLHQIGYERTSRFDYRNYCSFAPPSPYVQSNFGISYSGYSIQVIPKWSNEIATTEYFLDYKKSNMVK